MSERIAKAWEYQLRGFDDWGTTWAPTSSKARYEALRGIQDSYSDATFADIRIRRAAHMDRRLPGEHRLVAELDQRDREIILNAYGFQGHRPERAGYRDHYCCHPGNARMLRLAWELGLFRGPFGEGPYGTSPGWAGAFFYLSDLGKHVALSMVPTYC